MWPLVYIVLILSTIAAITRIHGERKDSRIGSNLILLLLMIAGSAAAFIIVVPTHSVNYMLLSRANYDITHDRFGQKMFTSASPNNGEIQSMIIDQMNAKEFDDTSITHSFGALIKLKKSDLGLGTIYEFNFIDSTTYDSLKQTGLRERK